MKGLISVLGVVAFLCNLVSAEESSSSVSVDFFISGGESSKAINPLIFWGVALLAALVVIVVAMLANLKKRKTIKKVGRVKKKLKKTGHRK